MYIKLTVFTYMLILLPNHIRILEVILFIMLKGVFDLVNNIINSVNEFTDMVFGFRK